MKRILLLHGALGSKEDLNPIKEALGTDFSICSINFYGHGGEAPANDFSIELFANQVLDWMKEKFLDTITIFGYSLGGYVGLYLALNYPDKIEKVITLGTKLYWDPSVAEKEVAKLDPENIIERFPRLAQTLQNKYTPTHWRQVLDKTAAMLLHIGRFNPIRFEDFSKIETPVLLMLGDRDKLVSFVETTTVYRELPHGHFAVLPNTPHLLGDINIPLLHSVVKSFVTD